MGARKPTFRQLSSAPFGLYTCPSSEGFAMRCLPLAASLVVAGLTVAAAPPAKKPAPPPAKSQKTNPPTAPQPVKGDPYSMTVPVDATAASASVAQNNAINGGRARAWGALSHRMVPQKDWDKLPKLDDPGLERLIRGYTVADEKRSTTRYMARVTYIFNPNAVRHLLRVANIGISEQGGSAILLVALSPSFNPQSPWARAVAQTKIPGAAFPLVTPIGDEVDQSSLGPLRLGAGWGQIEPVAQRVHAGEAVLMHASNPAASKMTVRMRRVGPTRSTVMLADVEIPIPAGTPPEKAYAMAAQKAEAAIEDAWKNKGTATVDLSKKSKLIAEVPITSLQQWSSTLARLAAVTNVSDVSIMAMNTGEGRVAISYAGTPDQLRTAAGQANLALTDRGGAWWVSNGKPEDNPDTGE